MKKFLYCCRIVLSVYLSFALLEFSPASYADEKIKIKADSSKDIDNLADNIAQSRLLFNEGKRFYKKRDYLNAQIKFKQALIKDPKNKKSEKYLLLCDKGIKKEEKLKERKRKKHKAKLESRAWGLFGVRKKGLEDLLSDIPAKDIPEKKLSLKECIDIAVGNSLSLEIAEKQVKLAKIRLWEARRKLAPAIKAKWEESSGEVYGRDYEGRKLLLEGSQPIFHGGEFVFTVSQAKVNLEIVQNDYQRIKNDLILKVEKAYYNLAKAIKFVEVQRRLNDKAKELHDFITSGYNSGAISRIEFLNVSSKYNQINFQFISSEEDVSLAKLILQQTMNTEEDIDIELPGEPEVIADISLDKCYSLAYANRPEMKINYLMNEYYLYEKKIAGARGWPQVDVMGMYGYAVEDYTSSEYKLDHDLEPEWYAGLKVSMPFFGSTLGYSFTREHWQPVVAAYHGTDSLTHTTTVGILDDLKYYSGLSESDVAFNRAKQEYIKIKQDIAVEVKETYFKYKKAILQMKVAKSKVEYQLSHLNFVEARRGMNQALTSDVLEQMIKLGEEEYSLLQAFADYFISVKALNKAVGILEYFNIKKG